MPPPPRRQGWEIDFTPQAKRWFMSLKGRDAERIAGALNQLERKGPTLRRPVAAPIVGSRHHGMKELRAIGGHQRALFAFDPNRRAIVLTGGDKTNNWKGWYKQNIPVADRLYDQHLRNIGKGEPWMTRAPRAGDRSDGRDL